MRKEEAKAAFNRQKKRREKSKTFRLPPSSPPTEKSIRIFSLTKCLIILHFCFVLRVFSYKKRERYNTTRLWFSSFSSPKPLCSPRRAGLMKANESEMDLNKKNLLGSPTSHPPASSFIHQNTIRILFDGAALLP
jgi:hypothetical protein